MKLLVKKATTDVTVYVFIQNSSVATGAGLTGLVFNSASLVCYYVRPLAAAAALTLATQTVTGAHSDGGFVEVDATNMPGVYRLDLSDAVCATGVNSVVVMLKGATNMAPVLLEIQLVSFDPNDSVAMGMTLVPANVTQLGGVAQSLTDLKDFADDGYDPSTNKVQGVVLVDTLTTYTGNTPQTGDSFARLGAPAGASVSADIAAIEAQTDDIGAAGAGLTAVPWNAAWDAEVQSEVDDALVAQRLDEILNADSDIDGAAPPTVGSVVHEMLSKTAGSFTYDQTTDSLEAIRDKETDIETDTQDIQSRLPAALVSGRMDASVGAVAANAITAAGIADGAIDRATFAADTGMQSLRSNTAQAGAAGTITLDTGASAVDDFYNGAWIMLTGGIGVGQVRLISDYVGSTKVATITGNWVTNPDATSTFAVLPSARVSIGAWLESIVNALISGRVDANAQVVGTGAIVAGSFAAGAIDAAAVATNAIDADALAADAVSEIQSGLATAAALATVQADTDDIQARLPAALVGGRMDSSVGAMAANTLTASALATDAREEIADQVWDEAIAGHLSAGSTGLALNSAGAAGDPWSTALPGAYGAGTAGKIVGDNVNATISSRASQTSVDTIDDFLDTEIAAILAKTNLIPAAPAAVGDIPTANQNADALLDRSNGIETGVTLRQAQRLQLSASAGKISGAATTTVSIRDTGDSKNRIVATVDASGNRTAVTLDAT